MNCKGFTLLEVIVALVVLVAAVVSFGAAYNMYVNAQYRQELYQDVYITALSLKNTIEVRKLVDEPGGSGELNGFFYSYSSKQVKTARNYINPDPPSPGGNIGPFELTLYQVDFELSRDRWKGEFSFYVTQFKGNPTLFKGF
jgi:prepilin-type N-terminal cleavage/methylation domain-containing protein